MRATNGTALMWERAIAETQSTRRNPPAFVGRQQEYVGAIARSLASFTRSALQFIKMNAREVVSTAFVVIAFLLYLARDRARTPDEIFVVEKLIESLPQKLLQNPAKKGVIARVRKKFLQALASKTFAKFKAILKSPVSVIYILLIVKEYMYLFKSVAVLFTKFPRGNALDEFEDTFTEVTQRLDL